MENKVLNLSTEYFTNTELKKLNTCCNDSDEINLDSVGYVCKINDIVVGIKKEHDSIIITIINNKEEINDLDNFEFSGNDFIKLSISENKSYIDISNRHKPIRNYVLENKLRTETLVNVNVYGDAIASIDTDYLNTGLYTLLKYIIIHKTIWLINSFEKNYFIISNISPDPYDVILHITKTNITNTIKVNDIDCPDLADICNRVLENNNGNIIVISNSCDTSEFFELKPFIEEPEEEEIKMNIADVNIINNPEKLTMSSNPNDFKGHIKFAAIAHKHNKILLSTVCWINETRLCYSDARVRELENDDEVTITYIATSICEEILK